MRQRGRKKSVGSSLLGWGLGTVAAVLLTGCAATVGPAYVGGPYDPYYYPPDYGYYGPSYGGVIVDHGYSHYHPQHYVHEYSHRGFEYHHSIDSPHHFENRAVGRAPAGYQGQGHGSGGYDSR